MSGTIALTTPWLEGRDGVDQAKLRIREELARGSRRGESPEGKREERERERGSGATVSRKGRVGAPL